YLDKRPCGGYMHKSVRATKLFSAACVMVGLIELCPHIASGQSRKPPQAAVETANNKAFAPSPLLSVSGLEQQIASERVRRVNQWSYKQAYLSIWWESD